jgi:hypothetical protein
MAFSVRNRLFAGELGSLVVCRQIEPQLIQNQDIVSPAGLLPLQHLQELSRPVDSDRLLIV